jgi:D-cysteine desulfhydrase
VVGRAVTPGARLAELAPGLGHVVLGASPTPVRLLDLDLGADVWLKDESVFGDGGWGGNKVRKLQWIIPEARRRGSRTLFTVGGIGTHWGLACALYGREHGLETVLGLVDQPVDDHVREQLTRLEASGARLYRFPSTRRLKLAAPWILLRHRPWYLPAGGSNAFGTLGYVDVALEIAGQVAAGELPAPGTVVVPVGSGGTVTGLTLGFRLAGLDTRVLGAVVNDMLPLDAPAMTRLAGRTSALLRARGLTDVPELGEGDFDLRDDWLGTAYGDPTPASVSEVERAREQGLSLEPVYTGKSLAAIRSLAAAGGSSLPGPVLWLNTHGPRKVTRPPG